METLNQEAGSLSGLGGAQLREAHRTSADRISDSSSSLYHFFLQIRGEIRLQRGGVWMDMSCMECRKELRKPTNVIAGDILGNQHPVSANILMI